MAGPYYVDPAASGAADGSSWTDAWTTLQTAVDTAAAGEIIYCRGTQVLAAAIDIDQNNGTSAAPIKVIGCNASGDVDGTRFTLNGNSAAANCLSIAASKGEYWWFVNIDCTSATGAGIAFATGAGHGRIWINCIAQSCGSYGWEMYTTTSNGTVVLVGCQSLNNSGDGFYSPYYGVIYFACKSVGNSGHGFGGAGGANWIIALNCVSHGNTGDGIAGVGKALVCNCVIDENGSDGIEYSGASPYIAVALANRITGNGTGGTGYGINEKNTGLVFYGWNFFLNNDGVTNGDCHAIPYHADTDTNETSGTEGYTDGDNDDFNLTSAATLRSVAIEID